MHFKFERFYLEEFESLLRPYLLSKVLAWSTCRGLIRHGARAIFISLCHLPNPKLTVPRLRMIASIFILIACPVISTYHHILRFWWQEAARQFVLMHQVLVTATRALDELRLLLLSTLLRAHVAACHNHCIIRFLWNIWRVTWLEV